MIWVEKHTSDKVTIRQLQTTYTYGIDITKFDEVDCFKANKNLKYLYFDVLVPEKTFILKRDIDYVKIQNETWHRQSEFVLSQTDIEDIIDFCKDNTPKNYTTELSCEYLKYDCTDKSTDELKIMFYGNESNYDIHHSSEQFGYYLRIIFTNGINLLYKFENGELMPYMYSFKKKIIFAKEEFKKEYEYVETPQTDSVKQKEQLSWWKKTWNNITSLFSKTKQEKSDVILDSESTQEQKSVSENERSWWKKTWNNVTGIFSPTESEKDKVVANNEKLQVQESETDEELSWWQKLWSFVVNIWSDEEDTSDN